MDEFRLRADAVVAVGTVELLGAPRRPPPRLGRGDIGALAGQPGEAVPLLLVVLELLLRRRDNACQRTVSEARARRRGDPPLPGKPSRMAWCRSS